MKTVLHTKIDKEIKEKAQLLASELGIPLSIIINAQLREFVRSGQFSVAREPVVGDKLMDELKSRSADYSKGKNINGPFSTIDEMFDFIQE